MNDVHKDAGRQANASCAARPKRARHPDRATQSSARAPALCAYMLSSSSTSSSAQRVPSAQRPARGPQPPAGGSRREVLCVAPAALPQQPRQWLPSDTRPYLCTTQLPGCAAAGLSLVRRLGGQALQSASSRQGGKESWQRSKGTRQGKGVAEIQGTSQGQGVEQSRAEQGTRKVGRRGSRCTQR